ncbi:MAG: hypothetical protein HY841_14365 [Bacteroidetes bacterium]|nr:hypothetical protein [Bacteroidota bacterium]
MNIHAEKISLIERITHINDETILQQVKQLLGIAQNPIIGYDIHGTPITQSVFNKSLKSAKKRYKSGKHTSQEDLEKQMKKW